MHVHLTIEASPREVRRLLEESLLPVRSLWFPTPRELREWRASGALLYAVWHRGGVVEVGPRVESLNAARFLPAARLRLREVEGHVHVEGWARLPRVTRVLLAGMGVMLVLWGASVFPGVWAGDKPWAWVLFWGLLAGTLGGGAVLGTVVGRRLLEARVPWLAELLADAAVEGEDW